MAQDYTAKLSPAARDRYRTELLARIPAWYSPWLHLVFPSLVGLGVMIACLLLVRDLRLWQCAIVPIMFLISNAAEWRLHRDVLHRRQFWAPVLYDRHTPMHHRIFLTEDMAIRDLREFRLVLIPAYGILLLAGVTGALAAAMWRHGQRNIGLLFLATCMAYSVSYEWLHLSYHLPPQSFIGRLRLVRWLRRHHAVHHGPE